jgi:hypothetical protein
MLNVLGPLMTGLGVCPRRGGATVDRKAVMFGRPLEGWKGRSEESQVRRAKGRWTHIGQVVMCVGRLIAGMKSFP